MGSIADVLVLDAERSLRVEVCCGVLSCLLEVGVHCCNALWDFRWFGHVCRSTELYAVPLSPCYDVSRSCSNVTRKTFNPSFVYLPLPARMYPIFIALFSAKRRGSRDQPSTYGSLTLEPDGLARNAPAADIVVIASVQPTTQPTVGLCTILHIHLRRTRPRRTFRNGADPHPIPR